MQYSPKLKKAMAEIKAIIEKHDIAAVVVLHTPEHSEYLLKIDPSYSCARMMPGGAGVEFKTKGLPPAKQFQLKKDTANMRSHLADVTSMIAVNTIGACELFNKVVGAKHGPGKHSSHEAQNN